MGIETVDYIVIGSGIAGLRAALSLAQSGRVAVVCKDGLSESSTGYAQGGVAVALSEEDEIRFHIDDTLAAGDGLCLRRAVEVLVEEGTQYMLELIEWGAQFDMSGDRFSFGREAAHRVHRILHAKGDSTGKEIVRALLARALSVKNIRFMPHIFTVDLVQVADGRVAGIRYLDFARRRGGILAGRAVLLASGGVGQLYRETSNPEGATGDGMAIAARAGAVMQDMEFVQFHPTALYLKGAPNFLISEAVRGEGGVLVNRHGEAFMTHYHPAAELAPRDVVSRSIIFEMERTRSRCVFLDLTRLRPAFLRRRFPRIYHTCRGYDIDITRDRLPVRPAAHYMMGGVRTDLQGRTSMTGLYAAGEVASTGVHGANRLASNSLLEGLVYGARAAEAMLSDRLERTELAVPGSPNPVSGPARGGWSRLRQLMTTKVGIVRNGGSLSVAVAELRAMDSRLAPRAARGELELKNMLQVGGLIALAALRRQESRGAHFREDFPKKDERKGRRHSQMTLAELESDKA
ncbi:MAG: L-aspartate oxidase [Acidobacteria bacterium]|nr:L-aspartate oxidase [Acidobacteriota bacterium]